MTIFDYVRYGNVFDYQKRVKKSIYDNDFIFIMETNSLKLKILKIYLNCTYSRLNLSFCENVDYTGELLHTNTQKAHNLINRNKSTVRTGETDSLTKSGEILYQIAQMSQPENIVTNHDIDGWILKPNTKYAFILSKGSNSEINGNFSILWNEY